MSKDPAVLFYTGDFQTGTELFTYEEKGMYIHILCTQHQTGHLPESYMLKILGSKESQVWKKFIQDENGLWYQKRMDDEAIKRKNFSESRRNNVKGRYVDTSEPTYVDTSEGSMKPHMDNGNRNTNEDLDLKEVVENIKSLWNNFSLKNGLSQIIKLSDKRRSAIISRLKESEFDIQKIFSEIQKSSFLKGSNGWKVDFDFVFCSANNYLKILEGKYRNGNNTSNGVKKSDQTTRAEFRHTDEQLEKNKRLEESIRALYPTGN